MEKPIKEMGLCKLGEKGTILPRSYRWTLHPHNHDNVNNWVQKLKIDYNNKLIEVTAFDDVNGDVHNWLADFHNWPVDFQVDETSRSFEIRHYSGAGKTIYAITFYALKTEEHIVNYSYENSEVLTHKIRFSYKRLKRTNNLNVQ